MNSENGISGSLFLGDWSGQEVPGHGIETPAAVAQAAASIVGAPVTVEHKGTYEAVSEIDGSNKPLDAAALHQHLSGSADPIKRPVGTVLHAEGTKVLIHIRPEANRVSELVRNGFLDLSLTHLEEGNDVRSLELSLVRRRRRWGRL